MSLSVFVGAINAAREIPLRYTLAEYAVVYFLFFVCAAIYIDIKNGEARKNIVSTIVTSPIFLVVFSPICLLPYGVIYLFKHAW
jgi:hypothetical protein